MKKTVCDRCGADVSEKSSDLHIFAEGIFASGEIKTVEIDLCDECREEFRKWMMQKKTKYGMLLDRSENGA